MQKIFYLPEAHTDFILAVIGEELGVAGICALLCLYGMIGYAGLRTARKAKGAYAKLLAGGLTSLILCQALLNVYAVLGLAPLTGVPLPFISSGSTSLVVLLCAMGLLLNIAAGGSAHLRAVGGGRDRATKAGANRATRPARTAPRRPARTAPRRPIVSAPRVVIAAGGTAGHVVPAIAVADALRAEGAEVRFIGGERAEAELVPAAGYELDPLKIEGISRSNPLKAARAAAKATVALFAAGRLLRRHGADVVVGGGGYAAGPVGLAAVLRGTPLVLTEADSHLGLTNRLLAARAHRVCLAFPIEGRTGERYLITGRPVPPTIADRAGARAQFGLRGRRDRGARVRRLARGALDQRGGGARVRRRATTGSCTWPGGATSPTLTAPDPHYVLLDYVVPFGLALAAADLAVARAGGSVFELAQYGLPSLLIPYPHASGNHQEANARWMERAGRRDRAAGRRAEPGAAARRGRRAGVGRPAPRRDGGRLGAHRATRGRARDRARGAGRRRPRR